MNRQINWDERKVGRRKSPIDFQTTFNIISPIQSGIKISAIVKIQNAIWKKKDIDKFSTEYANKIIQQKEQRQKKGCCNGDVSNKLVANILERSKSKRSFTIEDQNKKAAANETVSNKLVASIFERSLSKRPQSTLPFNVPIQSPPS